MELLKTWLLLACVAGSYSAPLSAFGPRHCSKQTCDAENARYDVGKTYIYHITAESASWINGTSEQKSSLKFDYDAEISPISNCELTLTLRNVNAFESNTNGNLVAASDSAMARELEEHVLRFAFHGGVVTDVCPTGNEKPWALNFKRSVLSAIQAPITTLPTDKSEEIITETDVTGKCPTRITRSEFPRSLIKQRDFKNCEQHSKLEGGLQATVLKKDAPLYNILDCSLECEVAFDDVSDIVSESSCKERHLSKAFSKQKSGAVTLVTVNMELTEVVERDVPVSTVIHQQTTILFDHEETVAETEQEILTKVRGLLTAINRKLTETVGIEMPNLYSDLVTEMRKVETLTGMTELKRFAEGEGQALYNVFKDALPMCETTASMEMMAAIITEVSASSEEAVKEFNPTRITWLTLPSMISHPTKGMISAFMPLIQTLSVEDSVFFLPISSLINRYCTSENPACLEEVEVRQALEYFQQLLGYDCTPSDEVPYLKMLMALKALTNARRLSTDSKISIINKCFDHHSPAKGMEIRIAALEVVRRLPCKPEYQTYAKAMYKNQHFDSELRIAAYRAIMTCPSEDIMAAIKEVLMEEDSSQVGSYVWSHLSHLNDTTDPQKQHLKQWVRDSEIAGANPKLDLRKSSRNVEMSWYNDAMASGVTVDADMVFSKESFLPRELKVNNTVSLFGYAVNAFEIGGRMEGMHQILESFFGPRGYFKEHSVQDLFKDYQEKQQEAFLDSLPDVPAAQETLPEGLPDGITLDMYNQLLRMLQFQQKVFGGKLPLPIPGEPMPAGMPKGMTQAMYDELLVYFMREGLPGERQKRHLIRETSINDIESDFHAHVEDHPHASLYYKMFGNELAYMDLAKIKNRLTEMKSSMNPMKLLMNLVREQTHEVSKNALLIDGSWTTPTIMGLPLRLAVNGTVSMKIKTEGKIDMRGILMAPRSFEINGVVEPSAALEVSSSMEMTARQTRSGLNYISRLHSSISLGGKIQVNNGKAFVLQVNVPDQKQEIIDISSSIYLRLQDEALELPGIPERLESSFCSGSLTTKFFGGRVCAEVAFPKSYANAKYPLYPLTGPGHMLVTLEKTDPSLTSWKLEGSYGLEKETVNGVSVLTDRFHLMMGAPETDIPRTFQVDASFNRNEKEMNLNVITPFKTVDVYGKVKNSPMLRKLETSLTLDKTSIYTLDAEVESRPTVVDGDPVINFYPRLDIASPSGNVLKYRSSISVRDGQQTHVNMWMSLDTPRTALVTVAGEIVKTESSRKVRCSSDLQITGRYVNVNVSAAWQKQKRDNIVTLDATVLRLVNGAIIKDVVVNAKYTNRTTEDQKQWDLKTEWMFTRFPLLSLLFEYEYVGTSRSSEATSKLCYRYNGEECSQDTKVVMSHLLIWETSESQTVENLNFKIRNPANNINLEFQQHAVSNSSHPVDFSFVVLNKTSELEVLNAGLRTRVLSQEPMKGDFRASLQSQTWRYAILEDWDIMDGGRAVLNTAVHWEDQDATFGVTYTPTLDEETGLQRYDFNTLLTYPLGRFTVDWYAWKKGYDVSHGASSSLNDQTLFAYGFDFTNSTSVTTGRPHINLDASFNITRPMSPISVALHASMKDYNINSGFNLTRGDTKLFTSGFSYTLTTSQRAVVREFVGDLGSISPSLTIESATTLFADLEIPEKDFSLAISYSATQDLLSSKQEQSIRYNGKQVYYKNTIVSLTQNEETGGLDVMYDVTQNMSYPLPGYDVRFIFQVVQNSYDTQLAIHRDKVPILFLHLDYNMKKVGADNAENSPIENTDRHKVQIAVRTPLAIMKDVEWNGTLDLAKTSFNFETRLKYFPEQPRPYVMMINYQDKGNELVTHKELTTTFETLKRRVTLFNMAKFDLGSGTILGTTSVKMGSLNDNPDNFEVSVEYTNKTEDETRSHKLALTLTSPDNVIKTEGVVSYITLTSYTTDFSIQVSEEPIYSSQTVFTNNSNSDQKSFDVDTTINYFGHGYRIHMVHVQDADSFHPNVKVFRAEETNPMAEADVSYTRAGQSPDTHTVILTLNSEETDPMTINTVFTRGDTNENVQVVISTSEDKHLDITFNLDAGLTPEGYGYDATFQVDNTYLPNRQFELTTHFDMSDSQLNWNTDLRISQEHLMNMMYQVEMASVSETHTTRTTRFQISFPQMEDYPALLNLGLRSDQEVQPDVTTMRREVRWGQLTDAEAAAVTVTSRSDMVEIQVVHPMDLVHLPNEINLILRNNTIPTAKGSFEIEVNDEATKLMMLSGAYALIDGNDKKRRASLTFTRPGHADIELALDAAVMNENTIFGSELTVKYSEDENRLVTAMIEVINQTDVDSMGFDIHTSVLHTVSGLDVSTALSVVNDKRAFSAGIEGEILVDDQPRPFNFEIKWDKKQEMYTVVSDSPWNEMVFTGQFEDRSYADYKVYRLTMTNTYSGERVVRSLFEFNSQSQEISYTVNHNPDDHEDFMRFRAGFLNDTALLILLDSEKSRQYSVDARLLVALETPKILQTHLQWNPMWVDFLNEKIPIVYGRLMRKAELRQMDLEESRASFSERVKASYNDFVASNPDIKSALEEMKDALAAKFEAKKEQFEAMKEDFKTKWETYWNQLALDMAPYQEQMQQKLEDLKVKFDSWLMDLQTATDGYTKTTEQRVKDFYNKHVKPIFEELREQFETLAEQHRVQMELLFPEINPYGQGYFLPRLEVEPQKAPKYNVLGNEDVVPDKSLDDIVETSILLPGQPMVSYPRNPFNDRLNRLRQLKIWKDLERLWNETKAEFEAILAEIDAEFKQSHFYLDVMEQWEALKEQAPVQQWLDDIQAKLEEIKSSEDMQELRATFEALKEELAVPTMDAEAGLVLIRERLAEALEGYGLELLEYLKTPTYELVRYDLENGEILFRFFLPMEIYSLQEVPESWRQPEMLQRLRELIGEVREQTKNTLGEIAMVDGTTRSMYELMINEPMLLFREGNLTQWFQGEKIKLQRKFWKVIHLTKMYSNPINWIPPHQANAMIVGANHYMTFDRTFYDFSSGCSYLLAHDFIDGNFTVVVEYNRDGATRTKSIVLYLNSTTSFEIQSDFTVMMGRQFLELPVQHGRTTITRDLNNVRIHNANGITITCHVARDLCTVNVSGWYFGKTAGLFGTYNYEALDDFTTSDGDMGRHIDDFSRSWKVGKRCSGSATDPLPECNSDPQEEANAHCSAHFLEQHSSLTQCLGVVNPAPYYSMCASKMCELTEDQREEEACRSIKAYVDECNRLEVGITMPDMCVVCESPEGKFPQGETMTLTETDNIPQSADVVLIMEEKLCNADKLEHIAEIVDILDSQLKSTRQFSDNRFGLLGFGGEGIHDLSHVHTIDGKIFNEKRPLRFQGLPELVFAEDGNNDTFAAIMAAANYPFRAGVAKHIILMSCSDCQRLYHLDKSYQDVASAVLRQGIQFNILMDANLELVPTRGKNNSPKNQVIYGIDNRTVFTNKALSSGSLIGDKSLRKLVNEPINQCALLAYESGGALFDTGKMDQKKFADVLTQRMLEHTVVEPCQVCSCRGDADGVGHAFCEPCQVAEKYSWVFDMERVVAEADYYARLGMQSFVDFMYTPSTDTTVNNTPKNEP